MHLTGQTFSKPWQEPEEVQPQIKKTISFYGNTSHYNTKSNLWDNQYRTCRKTYNFYQRDNDLKNQQFEAKDLEGRFKAQQRQLSQEFVLKQKQKRARMISQRMFERKMVTFKSNQPGLSFEEAQQFQEATTSEDTKLLSYNILLKRSGNTFTNLHNCKSMRCNRRSQFDQTGFSDFRKTLPSLFSNTDAYNNIQPISKDRSASKALVNQIIDKHGVTELDRIYNLQARQIQRQKFVDTLEKNIDTNARMKTAKPKRSHNSQRDYFQNTELIDTGNQ